MLACCCLIRWCGQNRYNLGPIKSMHDKRLAENCFTMAAAWLKRTEDAQYTTDDDDLNILGVILTATPTTVMEYLSEDKNPFTDPEVLATVMGFPDYDHTLLSADQKLFMYTHCDEGPLAPGEEPMLALLLMPSP
jgi:hypothetical protein